jgi:PhoPQ-activated pathogenicity-related protein
MRFFSCSLIILTSLASVLSAEETAIPDALDRYVERPDNSFRWKKLKETETTLGTVHHLHLVSQTWHDIVWEHALTVYEPTRIEHGKHMLLFVSGGSTGRKPDRDDMELGLKLANGCGACVAFLPQVPNQPLLGNRREDDLITETWLRYLDTGDETWPLLFPMVKSAVKAMDALEQFSAQGLDQKAEKFVITGASKRGWTSWLTPAADSRVVATAPIVIDVLNFMAQMKNQQATWGKYSEQIVDYTSKGLVKTSEDEESEREKKLRIMMDPWTYRSRLTLPKLMIVGTNDPYWVVDAMNIYWKDLEGPKYVLQIPNADHGLDGGREHALNTLAMFFQHVAGGKPMPKFTWNVQPGNPSWTLSLNSEDSIQQVKLWKATSPTLDFRKAEWTSEELKHDGNQVSGKVVLPTNGDHIAMFAEVTFLAGERPFSLTTLVYKK